jgi:hypothetical protein
MPELTIGAGYVKALLDLAVSKGASRQVLVQRAEINPGDLLNRDNRIPLGNYQALMAAAKSLCDEPALALQLGEAASLSDISIVGLIYKSSATNAEAFAQINRYGRLVVEVDGHRAEGRFKVEQIDGEFWMQDTRRDPNSFPELTESAFSMMICTQKKGGHPSYAKAIHFTHDEPANLEEYHRILNVPLVFNSDKNAILFNPALMLLPLSKADDYTFGIFSERADALLVSLQGSKTIRGQVEGWLIPILHTGTWSMDRLAEALDG